LPTNAKPPSRASPDSTEKTAFFADENSAYAEPYETSVSFPETLSSKSIVNVRSKYAPDASGVAPALTQRLLRRSKTTRSAPLRLNKQGGGRPI